MVSRSKGNRVEMIGESMFLKENPTHLQYALEKKQHYLRKSLSCPELKSIAESYRNLFESIDIKE